MNLFDVTLSVVYIVLTAMCFISSITVLRNTYDRTVLLRMSPNELKRVEYSTT